MNTKQKFYVMRWEGRNENIENFINNFNRTYILDGRILVDFEVVSRQNEHFTEILVKYERDMTEVKRLYDIMYEAQYLQEKLRKYQRKNKCHYFSRFLSKQRKYISVLSDEFNPDLAFTLEQLKDLYYQRKE